MRNLIEPAKLTILVGSKARGTHTRQSDADIVRVGHKKTLAAAVSARRLETSYIDFDGKKFADLYQEGSLFLHHILTEGRLLYGERKVWMLLKENFRVSTNFSREISENRELLKWLQEGDQYRGATVPYLAHTFRALKNLAIFSLAQKRSYIFDKRAALSEAFPQLEDETITLLIDANNLFERSSGYTACSARPRRFGCEVVFRVREQVARVLN